MQFDGDDTMRIGKVIERVKEPSTMAGLAVLLSLFGLGPDESLGVTETIVAAVSGLFGLLAVFVPEKRGR